MAATEETPRQQAGLADAGTGSEPAPYRGWHPDPACEGGWRFWDGEVWLERGSSDGESIDASPPRPEGSSKALLVRAIVLVATFVLIVLAVGSAFLVGALTEGVGFGLAGAPVLWEGALWSS